MKFPTISVADLLQSGNAEVKTGPFGTQLKARDYVSEGTPVINVRNIGFGNIRKDKLEYIGKETVQRLASHLLRPEDIVFGRKGAVERHAFIQQSQSNWFQGSDCLRLRLSSGLILPRFASYYLLTYEHQQWMTGQCSHGATMASLNQDIISRIQFPCPPIATQRRIASILSAYDALIENNTRRISILEEIARRIYEEWFVRFRFPGHEQVKMVESELGLIPEGWQVQTVADFGKVITGKTPSKSDPENFGDDVPFIKTPDMHGNLFCISTREGLSAKGAESQKGKTLPENSLCVSCIGTAGVVSITTRPAQTNQQINAVVLNEQHNREFLYFALVGLRETINLYGANGATMVNLNKNKFEGLKIVYGDSPTIDHYHTLAFSFFEEIRVLQLKNANLRATRDLLLPKLMSGELDVSSLPEPEEVITA